MVFSAAIISGFSIWINKYSVSVINPYIFTFLKNIAVVFLLTCLLSALKDWTKFKKLTGRQWVSLILIGLVGGSIPFLLFFKGLSLTTAAQGSFIHKTMFVYVAILAAIFLKEKVNREFLAGALFLLVGNALLLNKLSFTFGKGDILILAATFFWAIENIISKNALKKLDARIVGWGRMFFGSLFILFFLGFTGQIHLLGALKTQQIVWTLITSAILFGYVITWYSGLKHVPATTATAILMLGSPITTLLALASGGKINAREVIAGSLIAIGIIIILNLYKKIILLRRENYVRA